MSKWKYAISCRCMEVKLHLSTQFAYFQKVLTKISSWKITCNHEFESLQNKLCIWMTFLCISKELKYIQKLCLKSWKYFPYFGVKKLIQSMADIRAEPAVVKSFVSNIIEVRHLSECYCIDPNDSLEWSVKQKIFLLRAQL